MAQHTAEHLLSQCLLAAGNLATVSVHFGDETTTIEVASETAPEHVLADAERRANAIARENRAVHTRELDREEALRLSLRRKPPEGDRLRIVEIDGYDRAACGGVHVTSTGSLAPVKITVSSASGEGRGSISWQETARSRTTAARWPCARLSAGSSPAANRTS